MKLIDLLVQELPKRGGWPEGVAAMAQDTDGDVKHCSDTEDIKIGSYVTGRSCIGGSYSMRMMEVTEDQATSIVTREQYEAALAAAQQPVWDGEGLPPVGCECEAKYRDAANAEWFIFRCVGVDCGVAFGWAGKEAVTLDRDSYEFRPIRSEADRKRDEVGLALYHAINWNAEGELASPKRMEDYKKAYDAIAAGNIPHIRIE